MISSFMLWVKHRWGLVALVVGGLISFFLLGRRRPEGLGTSVERLKEIQESEADALRKSQEIERKERVLIEKRHQEALQVVQKGYDAAQKKLTFSKKREVKKIVEESATNPEELARRLSKATGFKVIMPESEEA